MFLIRVLIVAIFTFLMSLFNQNAFASDSGLLKLEVADAVAEGMGGAFVGEADRPSAVYYNPAGITQLVSASVSAGVNFFTASD